MLLSVQGCVHVASFVEEPLWQLFRIVSKTSQHKETDSNGYFLPLQKLCRDSRA